MELDRTRTQGRTPRPCYRCGIVGHYAKDCPTAVDIRAVDILDKGMLQLGDDLLEELMARMDSARVGEDEPMSGRILSHISATPQSHQLKPKTSPALTDSTSAASPFSTHACRLESQILGINGVDVSHIVAAILFFSFIR